MDINFEYVVASIFLQDKTLEDIEFPSKWVEDPTMACYVANDEKYYYSVEGEKGKRPIVLPFNLLSRLK
jgi:hypothetical protein